MGYVLGFQKLFIPLFSMSFMLLTKSNYLLGLQCPKLLWTAKNEKEKIPEPDEVAQARFSAGNEVGELAKKLYPEGIDLSGLGFKENIDKTKEALEKRVPLFEAGFMIDNLYARADVLVPTGKDHWDIVEVKSATKVKEVNIDDVSFQKYVYEKAGLKIRNCIVMHINNEFVKNGEIKAEEFFAKRDVLDRVAEKSVDIEKRIDNFLKIINSKEKPKCSIGVHCSDPYDCSITGECWEGVPDGSVFDFYRMRKTNCFGMYDMGITKMTEVSDGVKLNDKQQIQRRLALASKDVPSTQTASASADKVGKERVHKDEKEIKNFLNGLEYPIYYLDFETINPAIPKFDKSKPYQQIPFQYSLHVQKEKGGELKHVSFLAEGKDDPRVKFLQSLKDNLADKGTILVYNQSFEIARLKEGIDAFEEFAEWGKKNVIPRIKDLWDIFRNFYYYDPKQKGSASIKYVLPVLSDLKYDDLEIKNGSLASLEYERVTYGSSADIVKGDLFGRSEEEVGKLVEKEIARVYGALEKYCELDTMAEVRIVEGLWEILKGEEDK
jgi:hypothetical protein